MNDEQVYQEREYVPLVSVRVKTFPKYVGAFELHCRVPFAEDRVKDIVDNMMPSGYLPGQSRLSYIRYVRLGHLKASSADVFSRPKSLNEGREYCIATARFVCY